MTGTTPFDLEVSIVTLGGIERLAGCIDSLDAACAGLTWQLTVVDNSKDGQDLVELLEKVPAARVIRSEGRRGFAANHNLVLADIIEHGYAQYVLVLNDDTELDRRAVTALVACADRQSDLGAVAPRIRDAGGRIDPSILPWPSVGQQVVQSLVPRARFTIKPRSGGWLHGACLLVRVSALEEVGVLDPSFFLFFEDTDLCLRMRHAGWKLQVCDEASIVHHGHKTIGESRFSAETQKQVLRSRYLFFRKHHGLAAARTVTELVRCALMMRTTKMLVETSLRRRAAVPEGPRALWALTCCRPDHPTTLELDAERHLRSTSETADADVHPCRGAKQPKGAQ